MQAKPSSFPTLPKTRNRARRIAHALRAAGVEVWFDQSELRGGDAWDAAIRRHIKECALFVPIISANTQSRTEGYFRLEWKLADRRTDLIGKSKAFLLPVCIDDTRDSEADVPASFLAVQWTRLRPIRQAQGYGGQARTDDEDPGFARFVARVKKLLEGGTGSRESASRPPMPEVEAGRPRPARRSRWPWIAGAIGTLLLGYFVVTSLTNVWSDPATVLKSMVEQKAATAPVSAARELVANPRRMSSTSI